MITLFSHKGGPNGWKVVIVLEALGLKYETKYLDFATNEQKGVEHTKYNPNGRIPTIIDHDNSDFSIWESNAIIKYLVERYDKEKKFHFEHGTNEASLIDQWLSFQASGQGPYFGQAVHFDRYHPVKLPTAVERYRKEAVRVISVLDSYLSENNKQYLVGNKLTIADFVFIPWNAGISYIMGDSEIIKELDQFKHYEAWHKRVMESEGVKKMFALREKAQQA